jgi:hypothetical protein
VEVGHDEVGVRDVEVQRRAGDDDPRQDTEQKGHQKADGPQHGRFEGQLAAGAPS